MSGSKKTISLQVTEQEIEDSLRCGFRAYMFEITDSDGDCVGSITTGTGLGNDFINLEWKGRYAMVEGSTLLEAWVRTFDEEGADLIKEMLRGK